MGKPISGIQWMSHRIDDQTFDLGHLHPSTLSITIPATSKDPARNLRIAVSYSLHCFTRDPLPAEAVLSNMWYRDNREQRVFDSARWECSLLLPGIIGSLERRRCMHTAHEEFVTVEVVTNERSFDYAVFFTVSKAGKGASADLNLFVNSAHERYNALRYSKPVAFKFIALNRFLGRKIKTPP